VTFDIPTGVDLTDVAVRIGGNSWAACFTANIKPMPVAKAAEPLPPPPAAPAKSAGTGTATPTLVAAGKVPPMPGCVSVILPANSFCGAYATKTSIYGKMLPYQVDAVRAPNLLDAAGAFSPEGAIAVDHSARQLYTMDMETSEITFEQDPPPTSVPGCAAAYKRYVCANAFPVCRGGPEGTGSACNSACNNVLSQCKLLDIHKDFLDCPTQSLLGTAKNPMMDSISLCSAVRGAPEAAGNSASSLATPVAWLFVVAAALFLL
jgi:hypothetical protein